MLYTILYYYPYTLLIPYYLSIQVNQLHLDLTLAQQTEYVLKQMNIMSETIRLEATTGCRDDLSATIAQLGKLKEYVTETAQTLT